MPRKPLPTLRKSFIVAVLALLCAPPQSRADESETMVFAVDVIRHGDRGPIVDFPSAPYKWPRGLGQLTPEGMNQEFQLGKEFRTRYVEKNHLLPPTYDHDTLYVRASDIDRTLMSAECTLYGLYPLGQGPLTDDGKEGVPSRYQPIPIHTRPRDTDNVLVPDAVKGLPEIRKEFVYESQEWKDRTAKEQPNFERWSKLTGINVVGLKQLSLIGDTAFIRKTHHVPQPEGMTDADVDTLSALGEWVFEQNFKPSQVGGVTGMNLLEQVEKYFADASKGDDKLKWVLYSAHDSTISSVMSALKAPAKGRPRYSSDLNFALYKKGDKYTVKVTFNGEPVNFPESENGSCSLEKFATIAPAAIPKTSPIR